MGRENIVTATSSVATCLRFMRFFPREITLASMATLRMDIKQSWRPGAHRSEPAAERGREVLRSFDAFAIAAADVDHLLECRRRIERGQRHDIRLRCIAARIDRQRRIANRVPRM